MAAAAAEAFGGADGCPSFLCGDLNTFAPGRHEWPPPTRDGRLAPLAFARPSLQGRPCRGRAAARRHARLARRRASRIRALARHRTLVCMRRGCNAFCPPQLRFDRYITVTLPLHYLRFDRADMSDAAWQAAVGRSVGQSVSRSVTSTLLAESAFDDLDLASQRAGHGGVSGLYLRRQHANMSRDPSGVPLYWPLPPKVYR